MSSPETLDVVYHGSTVRVTKPNPALGADRKDFGRGFYTTPNKQQAEKFASLKAKRQDVAQGWVSVFSPPGFDELAVTTYPAADRAWFDFVLTNRGFPEFAAGVPALSADVIIGPVANDAVGLVLNQFIGGTYGDPRSAQAKDIAISLLLTQRLHEQVFFATERACSRLEWVEAYRV